MVLFIMLYKVVLTIKSMDEIKIVTGPIEWIKATEKYFSVVQFNMLWNDVNSNFSISAKSTDRSLIKFVKKIL